MTWKQVFTSSIGQKITMALTGIFLILFLVIHVGLNACIWANDGGKMFNEAAHFMGGYWVPRVLEIGLFAGIILHIIQGLMLEADNRKKRGNNTYAISYGNRGSKWYSRSMGLLGTIILLFLIVHLADFWIPNRAHQKFLLGEEIDLYAKMQETFSQAWIVIVYVIGCISLAYHLAHGFYSAFKTLGVYNKRYLALIQWSGYAFSIIVPLAFAMMPVSFYLGWL